MPNIPIQDKAEEFTLDALPPHCQTWLTFYDSLSPDLQQEADINWSEYFTADDYQAQFGRWPHALNEQRVILVAGMVNRDFMLARIAEELFKVRLSESKVVQLQQWLQNSISQASSADASWAYSKTSEELRPLFEVAFATADKSK
ncbi:hypothetical protein [Hymenobacter bucti]|uniref:hypothetical protein n=1 Tax=Hymenobacter bucti TaxID=1844114 RepID=UPI0036340C53